jgi:hypothetical protein
MGRATIIRENGDRFHVIFGHTSNDGFIISYAKPSRTYKTRAGAERAAAKWTA